MLDQICHQVFNNFCLTLSCAAVCMCTVTYYVTSTHVTTLTKHCVSVAVHGRNARSQVLKKHNRNGRAREDGRGATGASQ